MNFAIMRKFNDERNIFVCVFLFEENLITTSLQRTFVGSNELALTNSVFGFSCEEDNYLTPQ